VVLADSATASTRIEAAGLAPTARGEELTVADFLRIARAVAGAES
jgi:16S rRNA (adenine1518-N6/adenine1519-N6)-dimethyltransferase